MWAEMSGLSRELPLATECPLWVKSGHVRCKKACLLYPRKRQSMRPFGCPLRDISGHFHGTVYCLKGGVMSKFYKLFSIVMLRSQRTR